MSQIIVVTGGVISGVGKGTAVASIGKILQEYGFSVTAVKIDPYINYDAGTLRPTEHGEVWVTDDGGEIDQDLGNYERFLNIDIPRINNITTGQIYKEIIDRERRGEFLGQTVQFIPHVPEEIKRRIKSAAKYIDAQGASVDYDFVLVEIGGTVGDYENLPYLLAAKGLEIEMGKENVANILVSYLPVPFNIGEMKTKPTQQAIRSLMECGIMPDFVLCRSEKPLDEVRKKKIEIYANIQSENVISAPDIKSIYNIPLNFEKEQLGKKLMDRFKLKPKKAPDWTKWTKLVNQIESPSKTVKIAIVGKYVDIGDFLLSDSYVSINQALEHAGANLDTGISIKWIDAKQFEHDGTDMLSGYDGVIIPGGFGSSGVEGKIHAIKFARENGLPFLGLCYGLQLAVVEYARNMCGMEGAHTTEVNPQTKFPVIDVLPTQKQILVERQYGGSMRLGAYAAVLQKSLVRKLYEKSGRIKKDMDAIRKLQKDSSQQFRAGKLNDGDSVILERHRHRFEVNPLFVEQLSKDGLLFSGAHNRLDNTKLMEFIELQKHRFFVGTQAHPEFKSRLLDPAPLFLGFVEACKE